MLRQSNQKDQELHKVQINSGLTSKKLQITRIFKFFRSVTAVTLCFFSLVFSGSFGFVNLLIFRVWLILFWSTSDAFWWSVFILQLTYEYQPECQYSHRFVPMSCPTANSPRTAFGYVYTSRPRLLYRTLHFVQNEKWILKDGLLEPFSIFSKIEKWEWTKIFIFHFQILRKMNWHSGTRIKT